MTESSVTMPSNEVRRLCADALFRIRAERQAKINEWAVPKIQRHANSRIRKWLNNPVVTVEELIQEYQIGGIMQCMDVFEVTNYRRDDEHAILKLQTAAQHADAVTVTTSDLWSLIK